MNSKDYFKVLDDRERKLFKKLNYIFESSKTKYKQELVKIAKKDANFIEKVLNYRLKDKDFGAIKGQMFREIDELNILAYEDIAEHYYKLAIKQLETMVDRQVEDKYNEETFKKVLNKFIVGKGINYAYPSEMKRRMDYFDSQMINANLSVIYAKAETLSTNYVKRNIDSIVSGYSTDDLAIRSTLKAQKHQMSTFIDNVAVSIATSSALQAFEDNGLEKVVWIAEDDDRTCSICADYSGKVYTIDKVPSIPVHANCRCHIEPYKEKVE